VAIPFTVLPSGLWRIAAVTLHLPIFDGQRGDGDLPSWLPVEVYVVLLTIASELLAFTAIGLIASWGEVFPRRIPWLGGRRVPPLAAAIPATIGATVLTLMWTTVLVTTILGRDIQGRPRAADNPLHFHDWDGLLAVASYAPLVLWGPLLGAVTVAYWRRRDRGHLSEPRSGIAASRSDNAANRAGRGVRHAPPELDDARLRPAQPAVQGCGTD
jgi:hypothetical protein